MSYYKYLRRQHAESVQGFMDPSYFDATLAYVMAHNPGVRGRDRDWALFLHGVNNGAEASFESFYPLTTKMEETLGKAFSEVEEALAHSDHLELSALEPLLAARNTLAAFTKEAWDRFYHSLQDWASGAVGLKVENLTSTMSQEQEQLVAIQLNALMTEGRFHPFMVWAIHTYARKEDLSLIGFQAKVAQYLDTPAKPGEITGMIGEVTMIKAVSQYLKWARLEWQAFRAKVHEKALPLVLPDEKLGEWILRDLMQVEEDEDDD